MNQKKIIKEILNVEKKIEVEKVMGGRHQYSNYLFEKDDLCSDIFNYFNKIETFEKIQEYISSDSNQFLIKDNPYKRFFKKTNFFHAIAKKFFPSMLKNSFFLEMDFSVAKNNYYRESHHDKDTRILSFLIYLNNTKASNGGSLEIYEFKKNFKSLLERFPKKNNLILHNRIKPQFGQFIAFISSPDSIHGVEKFIAKNNEKRIFLYGSYTAFNKVNWIKS